MFLLEPYLKYMIIESDYVESDKEWLYGETTAGSTAMIHCVVPDNF